MDLSALEALQKNSKRSYNDQKAIIKKVLAGRAVSCKVCHQPIMFNMANQNQPAKVCCAQGCTDIELDIS
ncbi:hypothetical protein [Thalassotalea euphylliae]|uniref:Uncharacterized protein n=1 Tax=Thalassotalea euphylliae TaxID=1655234 RepID=A0A3E0U7Q3_9GAMM|nr:hypothetical protein [Thalassotalea euphylliae]REL32155.1 hypothetical protein DXX94_16305 [Thalassotalea euphylliae]